jgi:integrase
MGKERKKKDNKKLRRPNGHGTVYKLKGRRRKPWVARAAARTEKVPGKNTGELEEKTIRPIIGYYKSESEANKALLMYQYAPLIPKADITLGELYDEWSSNKYKRISKSTRDTYKAAWNYLSVHQDVKFAELRKAHIQETVDNNEGKSRSTLEKIKALASMLYKYAMENDIASKNYAEFVELPKKDTDEREIFTDLEIKKMFDNADMEWVDTILILIYSGLRISELLELTKFSVDLKKGTIMGGNKTEAGKNRLVPIHDKIMPFVQKWYNKNGDRLICNNEGGRIRPRYYRESLYFPTLKKLGISELTPHSCRHTFASLMKKAGADELYIKRIMGHTSYAFTEKVYTHTDIEQLKNAVNLM